MELAKIIIFLCISIFYGSFHTFIFIFNIKDVCNSPNKHSLEHELFYGSFHILM